MDNYAVIGNPVAHSKSPQIHLAFAQQEGVSIDYRRILADDETFVATVEKFFHDRGCGLNITLPFKVKAYQQCTELNDYAQAAKAVNTISFSSTGDWIGANTDGIGLLRDLKSNLGVELTRKNVLILGAGGAVRGILLPLLQENPSQIVIANRTYEKAEALAKEFIAAGTISSSQFSDLKSSKFDIVINATAASLSNQIPPVSATVLKSETVCYDLAYSDQDTAFLNWAKTHHAGTTSDGLGMLIEQAAESYFIWRGFRPDTGSVFSLLRPNR